MLKQKMTRGHRGMRSGISLVEMMIAVILFAVISMVGYRYAGNIMNVNLSAKKARVAALVEQAKQLSDAYDIYKVQFGEAPTAIADLSAGKAMIITELPPAISEIGAAQWTMTTDVDYDDTDADDDSTTATDIALVYTIDDVANSADNEQYCAILNNMLDDTLTVDVADQAVFDPSDAQYTALGKAFCYSSNAALGGAAAADGLKIVFIKEVN